jgi:hypothetical protein
MRRQLFAICLAVGALTGAASAQTVTIKIKTPEVGKSTVSHSTETQSTVQQLIDAAGKVMKDEKNESGLEQTYTETVLAKGAKGPTKWKRTYEKATRTENGKATARSFEGKTIVFERKDDKVVASVEGDAKIDPKDLEEFQKKEAKSEEEQIAALLPNKAVKVGEKWTVDPKQIEKSLGSGEPQAFNLEKSSGEGVLTKTYEKNGKQFGIIEVTMKLVMGEIPDVTFETPPVMELKISIDTAVDGSSTAGSVNHTGKMTMKGTIDAGGQKLTLSAKVESTGKSARSAEK